MKDMINAPALYPERCRRGWLSTCGLSVVYTASGARPGSLTLGASHIWDIHQPAAWPYPTLLPPVSPETPDTSGQIRANFLAVQTFGLSSAGRGYTAWAHLKGRAAVLLLAVPGCDLYLLGSPWLHPTAHTLASGLLPVIPARGLSVPVGVALSTPTPGFGLP